MKFLIEIDANQYQSAFCKHMQKIHKGVPVLSTELPANFTHAFFQNFNDYERPAWFSLENLWTQCVCS